jgi:hypothetical protein
VGRSGWATKPGEDDCFLEQVEVSNPHLIADAVLADPKKYGF